MEPKPFRTEVERQIRGLSLRRHAFSRAQLLELGMGAEAIKYRLRRGSLVRLHDGVYAVGGTPATQERRWAAAVLACGEGAVLSHLSAAALWRLRDADPAVIDTSLASRRMRSREGIRAHRPMRLDKKDTATHRGIPVTTVPRTLIDLAEVLGTRTLERTLDEAEYLGLLDRGALASALERNGTRTGTARLRAVLARHEPGTTRTRSPLEEAFLLLTRRAGLPQPEVNARLGPFTIDFLWRKERLAVETDGRRSHERDRQRERDSTRDAWLAAHGYRPLRFTWAQVTQRPEEVVAALEAARAEVRP